MILAMITGVRGNLNAFWGYGIWLAVELYFGDMRCLNSISHFSKFIIRKNSCGLM